MRFYLTLKSKTVSTIVLFRTQSLCLSEVAARGELHGQAQLAWEGAAHGKSTARISPQEAHPPDHLLQGSILVPYSSNRDFSAGLSGC